MRPEDGRATAEAPSGRRLAEGVAFALLAVSLWGGWFVITRRAVGAGGVLGPADLVALRFGIGGLLLLPVLPCACAASTGGRTSTARSCTWRRARPSRS